MATTNFVDRVTPINASWLNDVDAATYEGAGVFTPAGTGAVTRTVQSKLREYVSIEDFNPTADGTTDDLIPLTNFFNSAIANPGVPHWLGHATYATSGSLPTINVSGVLIYGVRGGNHDVGDYSGTVIKAITGCTGTILTITPNEGASAQALHGIDILGVTLHGNNIAARCLIVKSIRHCVLDVYCAEATTDAFTMDVATTLGESCDSQFNYIRYRGRQAVASSGVSMRLKGSATANTSFNVFESVDILHSNASAIIEENADNNTWAVARIFRAGSGTATNSIEWLGGASSAICCRAERFGLLSTTVAAIAKGTGTYTVAANRILIENLDTDNGTPTPTEETGASIYDNKWRAYTPTVTSASGTFTSVAGIGRYLRKIGQMFFEVAATITTNGTAASSTNITLPVASAAASYNSVVCGRESNTTGAILSGVVLAGTTTLNVVSATGTYVGANGYVLSLSGSYEI